MVSVTLFFYFSLSLSIYEDSKKKQQRQGNNIKKSDVQFGKYVYTR